MQSGNNPESQMSSDHDRCMLEEKDIEYQRILECNQYLVNDGTRDKKTADDVLQQWFNLIFEYAINFDNLSLLRWALDKTPSLSDASTMLRPLNMALTTRKIEMVKVLQSYGACMDSQYGYLKSFDVSLIQNTSYSERVDYFYTTWMSLHEQTMRNIILLPYITTFQINLLSDIIKIIQGKTFYLHFNRDQLKISPDKYMECTMFARKYFKAKQDALVRSERKAAYEQNEEECHYRIL